MRFCCVVAVLTTACVLAGCLVARAAPRRGGGGSSDPRWIQNLSPQRTEDSEEDYRTSGLVQRILERLQQRLLGKALSETNSWEANQAEQLDLQLYRPTDQEDEFTDAAEVPHRPAIKRKCIGRFQPYAMNC